MGAPSIDGLWAHVHALTQLSQCGSYTAAAMRLGISKASMSLRIRHLEQAIGVPLVQRTTRSVRLTPAGERLVRGTGAAFVAIADAMEAARDETGPPRGLVRMAAPVALARQQIVPRLAAFLGEHAQIRIEFDLSDRISGLVEEGVDLAIRHIAEPPESSVAWPLCRTRALLVASPAYLARHAAPRTPQELASHACLLYPRRGERPVWRFEPAEGAEWSDEHVLTVAVQGPLAANNSEALREATLAGLGIAILPDFSAQAALQEGTLVPVLPQWRPVGAFGGHIFAIRTYSAHVPRAVQCVVQFLRESLREGFGA